MLAYVLLLLLFSCYKTKQYSGFQDAEYIIPVPESNVSFDWKDRVEDYFYLPLETKGAILREIRHISFNEDQILVTDRRILHGLPIFMLAPPMASYKDYFISPIDSYYFSKIDKNKLDLKDSLTSAIYSQVKNIRPDNNPTLLFFKIRNEEN